ncbi:hypothetical protein CYMTET_12258 [Cymbomonas tetramitiformis]|uniref:Uncharacterized protein n=1 Tax=Cymbomonas tetramitiformis TaxID=36881 RepID=A0AAE0GKS5_9CHLO|nr:hypothetical protein CYMTET_12258 [Cymbomonas tetramitiformis]
MSAHAWDGYGEWLGNDGGDHFLIYDVNDEIAAVGPGMRVQVSGFYTHGIEVPPYIAVVERVMYMPEVDDLMFILVIAQEEAIRVQLPLECGEADDSVNDRGDGKRMRVLATLPSHRVDVRMMAN